MVRLMVWRVLSLVLFVAIALPARAAEAYQVATISSLLAGGYDGNATSGRCSATETSGSAPSTVWTAR